MGECIGELVEECAEECALELSSEIGGSYSTLNSGPISNNLGPDSTLRLCLPIDWSLGRLHGYS